MLRTKLREFVERTNINLTSAQKDELADELTRMIHGWLARPDSQRDEYLEKTTDKLLTRFAPRNTYSICLRGRLSSTSVTEPEIVAKISVYLRRIVRRVSKEASRRKYPGSIANLSAGSLTFRIHSVQRSGEEYEVVSHLGVADVPRYIVKRGVLVTPRKGEFKLESVKFEGDVAASQDRR